MTMLQPDPTPSAAVLARLETLPIGTRISIDRTDGVWRADIGADLFVIIESLWRVRDSERLVCTSADDGQDFADSGPMDAAAVANYRLGADVAGVSLDLVTSDLRFVLADGTVLEILTDSTGYESWTAHIADDLIVGSSDGPSTYTGGQAA